MEIQNFFKPMNLLDFDFRYWFQAQIVQSKIEGTETIHVAYDDSSNEDKKI